MDLGAQSGSISAGWRIRDGAFCRHVCAPPPHWAVVMEKSAGCRIRAGAFCRHVCAPLPHRTADMPKTGWSASSATEGFEKDVKIVGTNSTTSLESVTAAKSELKTNPKRTQNYAENCAIKTQIAGWRIRAGAFCRHVCAPLPHRTADRPKSGWSASSATEGFEKDVKIVGTNSTTSLESVTASKSELKTNSNRAQNLAKNRLLAPET